VDVVSGASSCDRFTLPGSPIREDHRITHIGISFLVYVETLERSAWFARVSETPNQIGPFVYASTPTQTYSG